MLTNSARSWGWASRALHWVMALAIIGAWIVGNYMIGMPDSFQKLEIYQVHKSVGLTIFALALLRLGWRFGAGSPDLPAHMPKVERHAARVSHVLFYALMMLIPITGYLMVSTSTTGIPTFYFDLFRVPHVLSPSESLAGTFEDVHELLGNLLAAVLVVHALAALKHHFWDKDEILTRMTYGRPT